MYNLPWQLLLQLYEVLPQNPTMQSREELVLKYSQITILMSRLIKIHILANSD